MMRIWVKAQGKTLKKVAQEVRSTGDHGLEKTLEQQENMRLKHCGAIRNYLAL